MHTRHQHLFKTDLCQLRPIQITVGYAEVEQKHGLAGEVRHAGGFPKDATPFTEFLWADFFRRRIKPAQVQRDPDASLQAALTLCHSPEAAHLSAGRAKRRS